MDESRWERIKGFLELQAVALGLVGILMLFSAIWKNLNHLIPSDGGWFFRLLEIAVNLALCIDLLLVLLGLYFLDDDIRMEKARRKTLERAYELALEKDQSAGEQRS